MLENNTLEMEIKEQSLKTENRQDAEKLAKEVLENFGKNIKIHQFKQELSKEVLI